MWHRSVMFLKLTIKKEQNCFYPFNVVAIHTLCSTGELSAANGFMQISRQRKRERKMEKEVWSLSEDVFCIWKGKTILCLMCCFNFTQMYVWIFYFKRLAWLTKVTQHSKGSSPTLCVCESMCIALYHSWRYESSMSDRQIQIMCERNSCTPLAARSTADQWFWRRRSK